jgi:hypothetical protein
MRRGWAARNTSMSAITPTGTFGSLSSLIRPASEMLVTPDEKEEAPINITFASLNLYGMGPGAKTQPIGPAGILSPEAKAFVPSNTPVEMEGVEVEELMEHPASFSFKSYNKSIGDEKSSESLSSMKVRIDANVLARQEDEGMPSSSVESVAAKNGHSIPSRPTLCALPPNLPKWAHRDPAAKRPGLERNPSSSSLITTSGMASISELEATPDRIMTPWRRKASIANPMESKSAQSGPSQPQPIQTENLSPAMDRRTMSAIRVATPYQGSRSWGIPSGSMASPARVPKMVTPTGLLGAVPMQGAGYK